MAHTERLRVSYRDIDMMDHVNNAAYFTYFETARCHYYESLTGLKEINRLDIIVAQQSCEYLRGLRYDEEFDVVAWPSRIGTTSFTLSYVLRTATGETVARGETVIVMFDYVKNAKKPIPAALRAKLEKELAKGPGVAVPV